MVDLVVTGAGGRIARFLRLAWAEAAPADLRPIWVGRGDGYDLSWDIGAGAVPVWPRGAVVLHLAGVVRGTEADLARNAALIPPLLAACAQNGAAALLFASTAGVYRPSAVPAGEDTPPDPQNPYGRAKLAAEHLVAAAALPVTRLRIGNVAGADALLGGNDGIVRLDPVPGRDSGPVRSWIGPKTLAVVLAHLATLALQRRLPAVLNVASDPPLPMEALLEAAGRAWHWGPPNPAVVPDAVMAVDRLAALCQLPQADAAGLIAEIRSLGVRA